MSWSRLSGIFGCLALASSVFATPDQNWVKAVFQDALNEQPSGTDLTFYTGLLGSETYTQVALGIMVGPPTGNVYFDNFINSQYNLYLSRSADSNDLNFYTPLLENGTITDDTLRTTVIASTEFYSDAGSTNGGFVDLMFQDALNRSADPATRAAYVNYLNGGGSRSVLATDVVESNEFEGNLVDEFYLNYLDRPSDATGRAAFLAELANGATEETVQSQFMGSSEYYQNAQNEATPEPMSLACLGLGFMGLVLRRRKR